MAAEREIAIMLKAYNSMGPGLGSVSRSISMFAQSNKKVLLGVGLAAGAVAGGIMAMAKTAIDFNNKMLDLKAAGELTSKQMLSMQESMLKAGQTWGVSTDKMADMSKAFVETSNDAEFLTENMGFMGKVMAATRANPEMLGAALGTLRKEFPGTTKDFQKMITNIYAISTAGGREQTFMKLLPSWPDLIQSYKAGRPGAGPEEIQKFMTMAIYSPHPESLVRAQKKVFALLSAKKEKLGAGPMSALLGLGIGKIDLNKVGLIEILDKVKNKFPGINDQVKALEDIFGTKLGVDLRGLLLNFDDMKKAAGSIKIDALDKQAVENSQELSSAFEKVKVAMTAASVHAMGPALKELAEFLSKLSAENIGNLTAAFNAMGSAAQLAVKALEAYGKYVGWATDVAAGVFAAGRTEMTQEDQNKVQRLIVGGMTDAYNEVLNKKTKSEIYAPTGGPGAGGMYTPYDGSNKPKPKTGMSTWSMLQGPGFELKVNATLTEKDKQSVLLQGK